MYFTAIFVILLKISFGLHLYSGIDQLFNALGAGKTAFKPFLKSKESGFIKSNKITFIKTNETIQSDAAYNTSIFSNVSLSRNSVFNASVGDNPLEDVRGGESLNGSFIANAELSESSEDDLHDGIQTNITKGGALNESLSSNSKVSGNSGGDLNDSTQTNIEGIKANNESLYSNAKVSGISEDDLNDGIQKNIAKGGALNESLSSNSKVSGSFDGDLNDGTQTNLEGVKANNESLYSNVKVSGIPGHDLNDGIQSSIEKGKTLNESLSSNSKASGSPGGDLNDGTQTSIEGVKANNESLYSNAEKSESSKDHLDDGIQTDITGGGAYIGSLSSNSKVSGSSGGDLNDSTQTNIEEVKANNESLYSNAKVYGISEDDLNDGIQTNIAKGGALNKSLSSNSKASGSFGGDLNDGTQTNIEGVKTNNESLNSNAKVSGIPEDDLKDSFQTNIAEDEALIESLLSNAGISERSETSLNDSIRETTTGSEALNKSFFGNVNVSDGVNGTDATTTKDFSTNPIKAIIPTSNGSIAKDPFDSAFEDGSEALYKNHSTNAQIDEHFELEDDSQNPDVALRKNTYADPSDFLNSELIMRSRCSSTSAVTSFDNIPAVSTFVDTFFEAVKSSETLTQVFDITEATASQFSQLSYRYLADVIRRLGSLDAEIIAAYSMRPIAKYFEILTPELLATVYANSIANFLHAEGYLTADNAEDLCLVYAKTIEDAAEANDVSCGCDYTHKIQSLVDGVTCFLLSIGQLSPLKAWGVSFYYAHEWLLAAADYENIRSFTIKK